jgi:hypothetical protein
MLVIYTVMVVVEGDTEKWMTTRVLGYSQVSSTNSRFTKWHRNVRHLFMVSDSSLANAAAPRDRQRHIRVLICMSAIVVMNALFLQPVALMLITEHLGSRMLEHVHNHTIITAFATARQSYSRVSDVAGYDVWWTVIT